MMYTVVSLYYTHNDQPSLAIPKHAPTELRNRLSVLLNLLITVLAQQLPLIRIHHCIIAPAPLKATPTRKRPLCRLIPTTGPTPGPTIGRGLAVELTDLTRELVRKEVTQDALKEPMRRRVADVQRELKNVRS